MFILSQVVNIKYYIWIFLYNNLRPQEFKYPVEHLANYLKGTKEGLYVNRNI